MGFDGFQTLDFGAFLAPPHERPQKGSRTRFLILKTRFPGGLPEVDFRAFSLKNGSFAAEIAMRVGQFTVFLRVFFGSKF